LFKELTMSLHTLANHMASHGRGPDSVLVHMSPREVQGLQSLALSKGGSLTINPQTGLPEAGFLEDILPMVAGFALNAFMPGVGTAVGGMLGLGGAAGTGLLVGGLTGLASGSLEKGLMAGLGAYGGAGLGSSLAGAGAPSVGMDAASGARDAGISAAAEASPAATAARLQTGANTAMSAPMDFLDKNKYNLAAGFAPAVMGAFDEEEEAAAKPHPGYIRKYARDPITGSLYQVSATPADQYTEGVTFGGVPAPVKYGASGGLTQHYDDGGITFGGASVPVDANGNPIVANTSDTRTDSQKAQDYLLGKPGATNPFLFYHAQTGQPIPPTKLIQAGIAGLNTEKQDGTRGGRGETDSGKSLSVEGDPLSYSNGLVHSVLSFGQPPNNAPVVDKSTMSPAAQAQADAAASAPATGSGAAPDSSPAPAAGAVNASHGGEGGGWGGRDAGGGTPSGGGGGYSGPASGATSAGSSPGASSAAGPPGGIGASPYAGGGGITALAEGGYNLGSYSDGGRLLRGPGDGVSDGIPATIGQNQPARLADGEFVVPARIVSELGNGSTEAGARKLYAMMDRVQKARSKTVGKNKVAANSRADKYLPV
jgi:hypothetical protein